VFKEVSLGFTSPLFYASQEKIRLIRKEARMGLAKGQKTQGDIRLDRRRETIVGRVIATGSLVQRKVGGGRNGEVAMLNYLASPKVTVASVMEADVRLTAAAARGRRTVAAQDTTEVNFSGRDKRRKGLGPGGDGKTPGFFTHATIAIDADDEAVIGPVSAQIWTRETAPGAKDAKRTFEDKESARWLKATESAANVLDGAEQIVVVGDRESDIYPLFARKPDRVDLVVRAARDRKLSCGGLMFEAPSAWPVLGGQIVEVAPKGVGDKGRTAKVLLKTGAVTVKRPARGCSKTDPQTLTLTMVEAIEIDAPEGAKPLLWRLITTLPATNLEEAMEVVRLYRLRWRIEQLFRTLKKDGLDLEATQHEEASRIMKLAALGVVASCRIMQLVDARGGSCRPATDAIAPGQIAFAAVISDSLEGATQRQKNPWEKGSLSWLAWIAARLGGWNCYYGKPGPKTMAHGWKRLQAMLEGAALAMGALQLV
jgi:Transposase DDE domain